MVAKKKSTSKAAVQKAAAGDLIKFLLSYIPVDLLLRLAVDAALNSIKNPATPQAKAAKKALVECAQGVERKWPGSVCSV